MTNVQYMNKQGGHIVHYNTNGGGRDTYVSMSNGGFTKLHSDVKWPEVGTIYPSKQLWSKAKPNPVMPAKNVYYRSNGTGRDTYIE